MLKENSQRLNNAGISAGNNRDIAFAAGVVLILCFFFIPFPPLIIDLALTLSLALSVLILMVALWVQRPVDFSSFPAILLMATMLRLALNVATTRLILTNGSQGEHAAGYVISGFSTLVMGDDFMIGVVVFIILVIINFIVITKGATRIAEVGARFTLDAIPGKQMAIDADLSAGLIDEKEAQKRRKSLEEESAFYGSMDGASKFVRGDAIAGIVILAVNIIGGAAIGVFRHGMPLGDALAVFTKLSVGDGLVAQIPALIISLAAGLLVSKGGAEGTAEEAITAQLSGYPRAMLVSGLLLGALAITPGLPFAPFALVSGLLCFSGVKMMRVSTPALVLSDLTSNPTDDQRALEAKVRSSTRIPEVEIRLGVQLASTIYANHNDFTSRVAKIRKRFAERYGFVVPEIQISDSFDIGAQSYQIRIHDVALADYNVQLGSVLVVHKNGAAPDYPGEVVKDPAYGLPASWVSAVFANELRSDGLLPVDVSSVVLTHLSSVITMHLPQLLSYRSVRSLLADLEIDYRKLLDDISPAHITYTGIQAVLKLLLSEAVSIRNLPLIVEAIAEISPHTRRAEHVAAHVRSRLSQQICADLSVQGVLNVFRIGTRWDVAFQQALKRDAKGEVVEFDFDPRLLETFGKELSDALRERVESGEPFVILCMADSRQYVRMVVERLFPTVAVLSHVELSRNVKINPIGSLP